VDLDVEAGGLVKRQTIVYNGVEVIDDEGKDIEHASWLSKLFLMWTTSMVAAGYRKPQLESEDLFQIRSYDRPEPNAVLFWNALERYKDEDGTFISYAIWRAIFRVAWKELLKAFLLELLMNALRFTTPVLLGLLVTALEDGNANSAYGYGLAFGLLLGQLLSTLAQSTGRMISISIGLRLKNALTKMTFEHILRLDQKGKQGLSNGKVVNLVSTDAQAALDLLNVWNRLVTAPIVLIAGVAFIYSKVGPSVLFGVLLMALFVPVTLKFAKIQTTLQRDKMKQTDIRVKLVNEMMQGVKILKLNSWEKPLVGLLDDVRKEEMKSISRLHYYRGITSPFAIAMPNIASVVTFIAYIRLGNEITPAEAFSVVSAFVIIRGPFSVIPMAISMLSKALVSGKRFTDFFALSTERANQGAIEGVTSGKFPESRTTASVVSEKPAEGDESSVEYDEEENDVAISMRNSSFTWTLNVAEGTKTEKEAFRLEDLNFEIKKGELVAVVGNIASGKSSLISSLIGDMEALSGKITCRGNLALCTQEPFIMNRTVRENILFEAPFEAARYNAVLEACALVSDLAILPASDLTEIGERGVNVSGGQKSRISLARAVYANPDVVLLDDPLSAVDAHVGKHIFEHCISNEPGSVLAGKTRVFVTNQLHLLDRMDRIILMADGRIVDQGTYAEIMSRDSSLIRDLQQKHAMQEEEEEEEAGTGIAAAAEAEKSDKAVQSNNIGGTSNIQKRDEATEKLAKEKGTLIKTESREKGTLKSGTFRKYWLAGSFGSYIVALLVVSTFIMTEAIFLSIDTWLAIYSQQPVGSEEISKDRFINIYIALTVGFFLIMMVRSFVYAAFSIRACRVMYARLQSNVFFLPMHFFWSTPMGRVLNRLSKDTNDIDIMLPLSMQWLMMTLVRVLGILVIISTALPEFLGAVVPFMLLYYMIREYYRRTSVGVQRIESILRSPVYSHLAETLQGVSTLRAFNRTGAWLEVANALICINHRATFAVQAVQVWLSMRLEVLGGLILFTTAICITLTNPAPGLAGLAIAYASNVVVNLNFSVQTATQVESQMNAVERVAEYSELKNEKDTDTGDQDPGEQWPSEGTIEFENSTMSYREDLDPALNGLNITIPGGSRVAIVGKTGAGKSTIIVSLLRLVDLSAGKLLIDGVDISKVPLSVLRKAITVVPQDPVLFTSSLRKNLDPFDLYTDEQIWTAIDKAHLRKTVDSLPDGLESLISQGGENLSVGQRQLTCIARAILRESKIVLLDEASAALDQDTDELIQQSIRTSFPGATLLVIAHRMNTIIDLDLALVMAEGKAAEFGAIPDLLQDPEGDFSRLVKASGVQR